jgi:hypothetical protein
MCLSARKCLICRQIALPVSLSKPSPHQYNVTIHFQDAKLEVARVATGIVNPGEYDKNGDPLPPNGPPTSAPYTELTDDDVQETAPFLKKGGYVGFTLAMIRNAAVRETQAIPRASTIAAVAIAA